MLYRSFLIGFSYVQRSRRCLAARWRSLDAPEMWRFLDALAPLLCDARNVSGKSPREVLLGDTLACSRSAWKKGHLNRREWSASSKSDNFNGEL